MDYQQQSNQGCLVVDLHYLFGEEPTRENEAAILIDGLFRYRDNYTLGCLMAFLDKHPGKRAKLYVDNAYYLNVLQKTIDYPAIEMVHAKNSEALIDSLDAPYIVYVDNYITDGFTHLPHFMLATGKSEQMLTVFDPWTGTTTRHTKKKMLTGVELLRDHVRVCPFVITEVKVIS